MSFGARAILRQLYRRLVPAPHRRAIYRALYPGEFRALRTAVHPSPKGTFSLRKYDELQTIFVHTPKAAGTSVALSIFGELPYHHTALDYRAIFGRQTFAAYFKFSFVRNPWDRVLSAYEYLLRGGWNTKDTDWAEKHLRHYSSFEDFVLHGLRLPAVQRFMHFRAQNEFVCDLWGRFLVDYLGYFETISADFEAISKRVGVSGTLAHENRAVNKDYRAAYTSEMRKIVGETYARDIRLFGYSFDGIRNRRDIGR